MSNESHLKDHYVARVVELTNDNKRLIKKLGEARRKLNNSRFYAVLAFSAGYAIATILGMALPR